MNNNLNGFRKYLKQNHCKLSSWARRNGIECYRIYNRNIAGIPFTLDIYKEFLHASGFENGADLSEEDIEEILSVAGKALYIKDENIYFKYREKLTKGNQYRKYAAENKEITVSENGLSFLVNLSDYLDTGIFLDHRNTRALVGENAANTKVLNLFAYTGTFSVYAAAGFAESTTTVDMSNTYLNWAEKNMKLNNFSGKNHTFINADVLKFINEAASSGRKSWDLIILDPPTFSNSRKMDGKFDIQNNHVDLINKCGKILSKKGTIVFSTNYRKFNLDRNSLKNFIIRDITRETIPLDYQGSNIHRCWTILKR